MEEQRGFVRLHAPVEAVYTVLPDGRPQRTLTRDFGVGGACLLVDKPLVPGAPLQVALTLPGREQPVNTIAEVVWSVEVELTGRTGQRRTAEVGIRTVEIAPQDQEALAQFITGGLRPGSSS
jgi:c-di-GMP-binding flagellar brake protein YcgR